MLRAPQDEEERVPTIEDALLLAAEAANATWAWAPLPTWPLNQAEAKESEPIVEKRLEL